jgi:hypothetical protein
VLSRIKTWGGNYVEEQVGKRERVVFALPKELARARDDGQASVPAGGTEGS